LSITLTDLGFGGMAKWITFFSQTGSEIVEISKILNRVPDVIVTNTRPESLRKINPKVQELAQQGATLCQVPNKPFLSDYLEILQTHIQHPEDYIISLHGWLRIMPVEVIKQYPIMYNGHPGLITKYPELKGKDPQEKAWGLSLPSSGCVIHKVTAGVDEGPIVRSKEIALNGLTLDQIYGELHETSIKLWVDFLKRHWL